MRVFMERAMCMVIFLITLSALSGCSRKEEARVGDEASDEIADAVTSAFSLEEALWDGKLVFNDKEDVYDLFRKGFSEDMARRLANYYWMEEKKQGKTSYRMLRAGDAVFVPPDNITVTSVENDRAVALLEYRENSEGPVTWEEHTIEVRLGKEEETWKIYDTDLIEVK